MPIDSAVLKKVSLFEGLTDAQLNKVAGITAERRFKVGQTIFREGDPGEELFVVVQGRVRISKKIAGVGEEALSILEPGSCFGDMALIDGSPRSAEAIAHTDCLLGAVGREPLDALMFTDKDLAYVLLWSMVRTLAARLRETNDKIKTFFLLSAQF